MPASRDLDSLRALQGEIESFIRSHPHATLVEDESELFDLAAASWRLTVEFDKLLLEVWNPARSMVRRIEEIAYRDRGKLGLFARRPGGRGTTTLEIRELRVAVRALPGASRLSYRRQLLARLARDYPGWKLERVSTRSDREHSFSAWYTRGVARRGSAAWAFLGLSPTEAPAAADALLAGGVLWLDWLRTQAERHTVSGLKLFVPPESVELVAHRAAYLDARALQLEVLAWKPQDSKPATVD